MGVWEGVWLALQDRDEQRRIKEDREYEREKFEKTLLEKRRDTLLPLLLERQKAVNEGAQEYLGASQAFASRFKGVEDPRVEAILSDPKTAAELETKIAEIERARAEQDVELQPLRGPALLEALTVYNPKTNSVSVVDYSYEDIVNANLLDDQTYEKTFLDLSTPTASQQPFVSISPELYRTPQTETLEPGREAFDQEVLRLANAARNVVADDPGASGNLTALIEGYKEENSAERFALRDMFGAQAMSSLIAAQNPYVQNLEKDPILSRYTNMYKLTQIINDPEASEQDRQRAAELLARLQG